ncbi:MAG: ubiquinol-cytochrome C chaperone family protein [Alphaproteobacteria bacterium]
MASLIGRLRARRERAHRLYTALVQQARSPAFYRDLGVPDTLDGRFDLIVLHAFLVVRRLRGIAGEGSPLGQAVFDVMMADMDQGLRALGVGDLGVGRRIKAMSQAFMGRCAAYDEACRSGTESLALALERNLYRSGSAAPSRAARVVARYVDESGARLASLADEDVVEARLRFAGTGADLGDVGMST